VQKVVGLLEAGTNCVNLMDQILHADDAILAQSILHITRSFACINLMQAPACLDNAISKAYGFVRVVHQTKNALLNVTGTTLGHSSDNSSVQKGMDAYLNQGVVCQGQNVLGNLSKSTLVDQLTDRLQVWVSEGNVRLHTPEHIHSCLVYLDEYTIVDLTEPQKLQDLAGLGVHIVNTPNANHKHQLCLWLDIEPP